MIHALSLPGKLCIHTDSAYVINSVNKCRLASSADVLQQLNNSDLLMQLWHSLRRDDAVEFCQIRSHRDISAIFDSLDRYHAYGNMIADQTAIAACLHLNPSWCASLKDKQLSVHSDRAMLKQFCNPALELQIARAKWDAANDNCHNAQQHAHASQRQELLRFLQTWNPDDAIQCGRPDITAWAHLFSWGSTLANQFMDWLSQCRWAREPPVYMPTAGVSWLELL